MVGTVISENSMFFNWIGGISSLGLAPSSKIHAMWPLTSAGAHMQSEVRRASICTLQLRTAANTVQERGPRRKFRVLSRSKLVDSPRPRGLGFCDRGRRSLMILPRSTSQKYVLRQPTNSGRHNFSDHATLHRQLATRTIAAPSTFARQALLDFHTKLRRRPPSTRHISAHAEATSPSFDATTTESPPRSIAIRQ